MRQIIVQEFVSIDGVMQAPGDPREYQRGGWQRQFVCPEQLDHITQLMLQADALLLGRKTYESFAGGWPAMRGLRGMADRINAMPKLVASTTLIQPRWNATVIKGELAQSVKRTQGARRQQSARPRQWRARALPRQPRPHRRYELWIHPVIVGEGKRLFPNGLDTSVWALAGTRVTPTGQSVLTYRRPN